MKVEATIADLAWLEGAWRGDVDGDVVEEIWGAPVGCAATGVFRWMRGDDVYLYEILVLEATEDGIWMRLRHFSRGLAPWPSEKDGPMSWRLVELEAERAVFENPALKFPRRIAYHRTSADALVARLEGRRSGEPAEMEFRFARRRGGPE